MRVIARSSSRTRTARSSFWIRRARSTSASFRAVVSSITTMRTRDSAGAAAKRRRFGDDAPDIRPRSRSTDGGRVRSSSRYPARGAIPLRRASVHPHRRPSRPGCGPGAHRADGRGSRRAARWPEPAAPSGCGMADSDRSLLEGGLVQRLALALGRVARSRRKRCAWSSASRRRIADRLEAASAAGTARRRPRPWREPREGRRASQVVDGSDLVSLRKMCSMSKTDAVTKMIGISLDCSRSLMMLAVSKPSIAGMATSRRMRANSCRNTQAERLLAGSHRDEVVVGSA